jgi:hypothetical protein
MERFSDRIGATEPRRDFQLDDMDGALRNALWNWLCWLLKGIPGDSRKYWTRLAERGLWDEVFHSRIDEIPSDVQSAVKKWFVACSWYDAYNLIQFVVESVPLFLDTYDSRITGAEENLNYYLEREMSGYRSVRGRLVAVTSPVEMQEIERAATPVSGFAGVSHHIEAALVLLAKKPEPDLRNSIKESISAVEAAAKLLTGEKSGGIDKALAILERKSGLHPSFKVALSKLYAYTSDEDGIRHPILDETNVPTFAEAKFMLVTCSAFANLLVESMRA